MYERSKNDVGGGSGGGGNLILCVDIYACKIGS